MDLRGVSINGSFWIYWPASITPTETLESSARLIVLSDTSNTQGYMNTHRAATASPAVPPPTTT
jgi:hypothetical protein